MVRTAERAGIAGETIEAVDLHEGFFCHTLLGGQLGLFEQAHGMLLRVDVFTGNLEIIVVVEAYAEFLSNLVGRLTTTEHGTGAFANADGIAHAIDAVAEQLFSLGEQLVVGHEASADIDDVDVADDFLRARNGFEILALGHNCSDNARMVGIRNGFQQHVRRHDGDAETTHAIGLHRKTALTGHGLDDGLDGGSSLHTLIGREVADVACAHGEHFLAQQRVFLVHHLLEHRGGIYARHVVVLEGGHEGNSSCSHDEQFCIHIGHVATDNILDGYATPLKQIPDGVVEQNSFLTVASQRLGDVEAAHTAILLLLFKEEELVGLHVELATDLGIVVDNEVVDAKGVELFATGQSRRPCADDGHRRLVDGQLGAVGRGLRVRLFMVLNLPDFLHPIDRRDANAADFSIDEHFAGSTLADAALKASVATVERAAMHGKSHLVKGCSDGFSALSAHDLSFILKFHEVGLWDV